MNGGRPNPADRRRAEVVEVVGRFADASNATLLAVDASGRRVVYKPTAGEQPLWDFPPETLAAREVLTYEVSEALGYHVVPETRFGDGPYGPGAVQVYLDHDEAFDPISAVRHDDDRLWPIAVLDVVANNADRKLGHLLSVGRRLYGIDHGLTFHPEEKLRTVLWGFARRSIPASLVAGLEQLAGALAGTLGDWVTAWLGASEREALVRRVAQLLGHPVHPEPPTDRPPIPWPPY